MSVKKFLWLAPLAILLAIALPANSSIVRPGNSPVNGPALTENPRALQLVHRLEEIKGMDKSALTGSEKKALRKEVKGIKKEMKALSGGVYLSVGAIIIIILLLILIL